jgi:large repetitive protein
MRISLRFPLAALLLLVAATASANSDVGIAINAPQFAAIGSSTTVTVNLTAAGGTAQGVTFLYAIPSGMTFKSLATSSLTCTTPAPGDQGVVTCQTATLAPSSPLQQAITLNVPAGTAPGQLFTHQAFVTANTPDPNSANDQAEATQTAAAAPSIQVTSTFPSTFVAGSPIAYTITVHNAGSSVQNVAFEERAVTSSFANSFVVAAKQTSGSGFTCASITPPTTSVQCSAGVFAAGATAVFTLSMETLPTAYASSIEHKTTVTASDFGSAFTLDQTSQGTQTSDVAVTSSAPAQVLVGADFTYTVNASDLGPSASGTITITWTTPPGTTFRSIALTGNSQPAMNCATPVTGGTGAVTCTAHDLQPAVTALQHAEVTAGFVVHVRAPSTAGNVTDNVTVTAPHDPNASNNTSSATTSVITAPTADLSVSMQASKASAVVGSTVVFTATITNGGPVTAANVMATFTVPSGTRVTSLPSGCTSGSQVVCTIASLASGAAQGIDIGFTLDSPGTKGSSVTVTADTADPDPSNNSATASTVGTPRTSDLGVTVVPSKTTVQIGETFTYQVALTSSGPDTVDAVVTGVFSPSLKPGSLTSPCTVSGTTVTCAATMSAGSASTYNLSFTPVAATTFLTTFTATTTDSDPNPDNNSASATVTALPPLTSADLAVSGQAPTVVESGAIAAYSLTVTNNGPAGAANLSLTFTPPPFTSVDSFTAPASLTCQKTNVLTCTATTMATGTSATIAAMVRGGTPSGAADIATAHLTADNDPDPSNNDVTLTTFTAGSSFSLFVDPATLSAVYGQAVAFTIRLLNAAATPLLSIDIQSVLPTGMTLISATPSSGTCSLNPAIACHTDSVNGDDLLSIRIVAMPPPPGSYTIHVAAASGPQSAAAEVPLTVVSTSRRHSAGH